MRKGAGGFVWDLEEENRNKESRADAALLVCLGSRGGKQNCSRLNKQREEMRSEGPHAQRPREPCQPQP